MNRYAGKRRIGAIAIFSVATLALLAFSILAADTVWAQTLNSWGWTTGLAPMPCALTGMGVGLTPRREKSTSKTAMDAKPAAPAAADPRAL